MPPCARRLNLILACFLALALASGSVFPSLWLWQCRHAAQLVVNPQMIAAGSMPCQGMAMANMPCCRPHAALRSASSEPHGPAVTSSACHPTLTQLAALTPTHLNPARYRQPVAALVAYAALDTRPMLSALLATPQRCRPPPASCLPAVLYIPSLSPRAPPAA